MLNTRLEAAKAVAIPLGQVEVEACDALLTGANLLRSIVEAQRTLRLSPTTVAVALAKVAAGNAAQAEALARYSEGHEELFAVCDRIGLRPYMVGDLWPTPSLMRREHDAVAANAA